MSKKKKQNLVIQKVSLFLIKKLIYPYSLSSKQMDFFPYNNFWRLKGQERVSSRCSVIASVIVVLALLALMIERIVLVAKMENVKASEQTVISSFPPNSTLTTYQNVEGQTPFMLALQWKSKYGFIGSPFFDVAVATSSFSYLSLESCTPEHFSKFSGFTSIKNTKSWMCLPLNTTISLYGSQFQSSLFSAIRIRAICTDCIFSVFGALLNIYTLTSIINPSNGSNYEQYYLQQVGIPITQYRGKGFIYEMTQNVVTTDNSLLPWEDLKVQRSWKPQVLKQIYSDPLLNNISITQVYIQRSTKTIEYQRSFYKFLDAFSFVGGMFQVILGAFFFMAIVGRMFFEFYLAKKYFRTQILRYFGANDFLQQLTYELLSLLNYKPKWDLIQKREKIRELVNNMMDVTYLLKRLSFLENSMSILLQKHQYFSLFLCQQATEEKANFNYKAHNFKDRLIRYLSLRALEAKVVRFVETKKTNGKITQKYDLSQKNLAISELDKGIVAKHEAKITKRNIIQLSKKLSLPNMQRKKDSLDMKGENLTSKNGQRKEYDRQDVSISKQNINEKTDKEKKYITDRQNFNEIQKNKEQYSNGSEQIRNRVEEEQKLEEAYQNLDPSDVDELNIPQLEEWIHNDFRKLAYESEEFRGDEMSKKIYNSIEEWFRNMLKDIVNQREIFY